MGCFDRMASSFAVLFELSAVLSLMVVGESEGNDTRNYMSSITNDNSYSIMWNNTQRRVAQNATISKSKPIKEKVTLTFMIQVVSQVYVADQQPSILALAKLVSFLRVTLQLARPRVRPQRVYSWFRDTHTYIRTYATHQSVVLASSLQAKSPP